MQKEQFDAGFKNITGNQFTTRKIFKEHGERELRSLLRQYTRVHTDERMMRVDIEDLTRTEMLMYLSSYLPARDFRKIVNFYEEGMKRISKLAKREFSDVEKDGKERKNEKQKYVCLKADKNIGITCTTMSWLEGELKRQLRMGSYEVVDKTDDQTIATIVSGEKQMRSKFTEREEKVYQQYYKSSHQKRFKLGLLRIQVGSVELCW